jgi:hypothetical protein
MKKFIGVTIKPVLVLGGLATALAGLDAFFPRFAVENVQKLEWVPQYTIFVQHWGIMVCLIGLFMAAAAFKKSWRTPILLYVMIEKAFMVYLVFSNLSQTFASGFLAPAIMDGIITAWCLIYFASLGGTTKE